MIFGRTNRKLREKNAELRQMARDLCTKNEKLKSLSLDLVERAHKAEDALSAIADQQTPGANATVRRMANIAREALGEENAGKRGAAAQ